MRDPATRRASNRRYESQPKVRARKSRLARERAAAESRKAAERLRALRLNCRNCCRIFSPEKTPTERYCSEDCRRAVARSKARQYYYANSGVDKQPRSCKECLKVFSPPDGVGLRTFCSKLCGDRFAKRAHGTNHRRRARRAGVSYEPVNRLKVFERDGWRCQVCRKLTPRRWMGTNRPNAPELDHRIPMSLGGPHTYTNVQCACRACNLRKGGHHVVGQLPLLDLSRKPMENRTP